MNHAIRRSSFALLFTFVDAAKGAAISKNTHMYVCVYICKKIESTARRSGSNVDKRRRCDAGVAVCNRS